MKWAPDLGVRVCFGVLFRFVKERARGDGDDAVFMCVFGGHVRAIHERLFRYE